MGARRRLAALTAAVALLAGLAGSPGSAGPSRAEASNGRARAVAGLPESVTTLRPLQAEDRRIVDDLGRDVLLRGANVNSLAEYWQGVPGLDTTIAVGDADWDLMASRGFSVVRLLITWSRVSPTRGTIDQGYLDQVQQHVDAAAARGIYTVIDMHQDAYSASIATAAAGDCAPGTAPAKGWDGAPAWATLTDGLSTCLAGSDRNSSPAVNRAWNNFYDNVDGIRDEFVAAWRGVAERFAGQAAVAGYDLLNEPETSRPAAELQPRYDELLGDAIDAIRAAEAAAPFDHLVFVEPAIPAGDQSRGLVIPNPAASANGIENVVGSVHNYAESIDNGLGLDIEGMNDLIETVTSGLGVGNWGGEYGFWDTEPETLAKARRYAADEDAHRWGGAWWQWRQSCGDPHHVQWDGGSVVAPAGTSTHLNLLGCPANEDLGPNEAFLSILGRGYPRATPGALTELRSDPGTGHLKVVGTATEAGGELVVWTPTAEGDGLPITLDGLTDLEVTEVDGGRILTATVVAAGEYALWIGPVDDDPAPAAPEAPPASGAQPISGQAGYTG